VQAANQPATNCAKVGIPLLFIIPQVSLPLGGRLFSRKHERIRAAVAPLAAPLVHSALSCVTISFARDIFC